MPKNLLHEFRNKLLEIEDQLLEDNFIKESKADESDTIEAVDLDIPLDIENPKPDYSYSYTMKMINSSKDQYEIDYSEMISDTFSDEEIQNIANNVEWE